jgi:hypothetical protein
MMAIYKKVQLANSPRIILTKTDITFKTAVVPDGVLRQELELELPLSAAVSDGYTVKVFAVDGVAGARPISNGIALSQSEIH